MEAWNAKLLQIDSHLKLKEKAKESERFIGTPVANSLVKGMLEPVLEKIDLNLNTKIARLEKSGEKWNLFDEKDAHLGAYDLVVSTAPAPQSLELLDDYLPASTKQSLEATKMQPCWAMMLR